LIFSGAIVFSLTVASNLCRWSVAVGRGPFMAVGEFVSVGPPLPLEFERYTSLGRGEGFAAPAGFARMPFVGHLIQYFRKGEPRSPPPPSLARPWRAMATRRPTLRQSTVRTPAFPTLVATFMDLCFVSLRPSMNKISDFIYFIILFHDIFFHAFLIAYDTLWPPHMGNHFFLRIQFAFHSFTRKAREARASLHRQ